jgi:hypothetical protein
MRRNDQPLLLAKPVCTVAPLRNHLRNPSGRLLRMPESGIVKMEERAEAARSRWQVVAAVATALLVAKSLVDKAMALVWRG